MLSLYGVLRYKCHCYKAYTNLREWIKENGLHRSTQQTMQTIQYERFH